MRLALRKTWKKKREGGQRAIKKGRGKGGGMQNVEKKGKPKTPGERCKKKKLLRQKKVKEEPETKEGNDEDEKMKEELSPDENQMRGERRQDMKQTAGVDGLTWLRVIRRRVFYSPVFAVANCEFQLSGTHIPHGWPKDECQISQELLEALSESFRRAGGTNRPTALQFSPAEGC
ncbi:hypothetical protein NDU88_007393 [Pleurodeles waltl]|uniref:Uncharacterized protein n=1 Tax=Pleurodeles waltl TaxID=8319 RepID=A0AAV7RRP0_PLEWA|nr:hypothetical protein NDU88_007393 [Pleurodeles waltl]